MPHIILEHNLDEEDKVTYVCKKLHGALSNQDTVKLESIKTRSIKVENSIVGNGQGKPVFLHVTLRLLSGRTDTLKKQMSEALLSVLNSTTDKESVSSVEVVELKNYSK